MLANKLLQASLSSVLSPYWVSAIGTPSSTASDTAGSIFVTDTHIYVVARTSVKTVLKLDLLGNIVWQRSISFSSFTADCFLAVDSVDNVYCYTAGRNSGSTNFPVLLKYDQNGNLLWQRKVNTAGDSSGTHKIVIGITGDIYISTGMLDTKLAQIAKYNSSGTMIWNRALSVASGLNQVQDMVIDASDNIYLIAQTGSTGNYRSNVVKYNSSGAFQFANQVYLGNTTPSQITVGSDGSIYCSMSIVSGATMQSIAKLNSSGVFSSAVYLSAGEFSDLFFDNGYIYVASGVNGAILKMDTSLSLIVQRRLYGTVAGITSGRSSNILAKDGNIYYSGYASQTSTGNEGIVAILPNDGTETGTYGWLTYDAQSWTTTPVTLTNATSLITDSSGTLVSAAGDAIDAPGTLVSTTYRKS